MKIRQVSGNLFEIRLPSTAAEEATDLFDKGTEADESGRTAEAISLYQQALCLNPRAAGALVNIGTIEYRRGHKAVAEEYYRRAIEADAQYSLAQYNLAHLLGSRRRHTEAIEHYLKALAIEPGYADAHFNIALEFEDVGELRRAIEHFTLYLRYAIGDSVYWRRTAQREIEKLRALLRPQIVPKPVASEQSKIPADDEQIG